MSFDINSAVETTNEESSIATTSFDITSAQEVPDTSQTPRNSVITSLLRFFTSGSPLEQMKTNIYLQDKMPDVVKGESITDYNARVNKVLEPRESGIIKEGVGRVLEAPITGGIAISGINAPVQVAKVIAKFTVLDKFINFRRYIEHNLPDTTPEIKDIAEVLDWGLKGGIIGYGEAKVDKFLQPDYYKYQTWLKEQTPLASRGTTFEKISKTKAKILKESGLPEDVIMDNVKEISPELNTLADKIESNLLTPKEAGKEIKNFNDFLIRKVLTDQLNALGVPRSVQLKPEQILKMFPDKISPEYKPIILDKAGNLLSKEKPKTLLTKTEQADFLETLGIKQEHIDASQSSKLPIQVPVDKVMDLTKKPYWEKVRESLKKEEVKQVIKEPTKAEVKPKQTETQLLERLGQVNSDISANTKMIETFKRKGMTEDYLDVKSQLDSALAEQKDIYKQLSEGRASKTSSELAIEKTGIKEPAPTEQAPIPTPAIPQNEAQTALETQEVTKPIPTTGKTLKQEVTKSVEIQPLESDTKISGLSKSVLKDAIRTGLKEDFGDLPTYKIRHEADIDARLEKFITEKPDLAKRIALGESPEQGDLRSQEIFTALRVKANLTSDVALQRELGISRTAAAMSTELGQRVQALNAHNPEDAVSLIKDIVKTKEAVVKKRFKTENVDKLHKEEVVKLETKIKEFKPKAQEWVDFVKSLQC